jgi:hypothetical protein
MVCLDGAVLGRSPDATPLEQMKAEGAIIRNPVSRYHGSPGCTGSCSARTWSKK